MNASYEMLICFFGHGCFTDSQCPWKEGILSDDSIVDENKKVDLFFSKMMCYIKDVMMQ